MNRTTSLIVALLGTLAGVGISTGLPAKFLAPSAASAATKSGHAAPAEQAKVIQIVAHKFAFEPSQITL
jgi:hypothetical protein